MKTEKKAKLAKKSSRTLKKSVRSKFAKKSVGIAVAVALSSLAGCGSNAEPVESPPEGETDNESERLKRQALLDKLAADRDKLEADQKAEVERRNRRLEEFDASRRAEAARRQFEIDERERLAKAKDERSRLEREQEEADRKRAEEARREEHQRKLDALKAEQEVANAAHARAQEEEKRLRGARAAEAAREKGLRDDEQRARKAKRQRGEALTADEIAAEKVYAIAAGTTNASYDFCSEKIARKVRLNVVADQLIAALGLSEASTYDAILNALTAGHGVAVNRRLVDEYRDAFFDLLAYFNGGESNKQDFMRGQYVDLSGRTHLLHARPWDPADR